MSRATHRRPRALTGFASAFTLVEVLVATALLAFVGSAILAFLGAFADGAARRGRISDPAIEGALAARRLTLAAPALRGALAADPELAALWLSDRVASRSVHLSELGWIRFDRLHREIVLEQVDPAAFAADPSLEAEIPAGSDFLALLEELRAEGLVVASLLAEGIDEAHLAIGAEAGALMLELAAGDATARVALVTNVPEEPLR